MSKQKPGRVLRPTTPITGEDLPDTAVEHGRANATRSAPVGRQFDSFPRHAAAPLPSTDGRVFHRDGGVDDVPDPTDSQKKLELIRRLRIPGSELHRPIKVAGHEVRRRNERGSRGSTAGRSWGRKNYLWRPREAWRDPGGAELVGRNQRERAWNRIRWPEGVSEDDKRLYRMVTVNEVSLALAAERLGLRLETAKKRLARLRKRLRSG